MTDTDDFLEHFGVKGMRWGVIRNGGNNSSVAVTKRKFGNGLKATGGKGLDVHGDAIKAAKSQQRLKKSGVESLSNKELKALVERMDLEQRYSGIINKKKDQRSKEVKKFMENGRKAWSVVPDEQKKKIASQVAGVFGSVVSATMKSSGASSSFKKAKGPYKHTQNY